MAGAVWGIDIGKAAIKAVKLRATKEGLEVKAVEHIDYEGGLNEDDKRADQVREGLKKFLTKHKVKNDRVLVALPGLHAFSRFIKLPPVDAKKVSMMVRMEAQQQIPFPIADVNWDFQKIERTYEPGEEIEVGIFATQRERIAGFLTELNSQGLEPGIVTIAPLAIYNFMSYNFDLGDEAVVVLDIGSDHTDLIVVKGPRFWIRNLRIAGNDITKALAERFKVTFDEAEKLKRNASKSDQSKKIFSSMEPTLKDLVGEVHRSVGFFKSQAPGGELKITKMILLGDGAKLKNLPPFFEKELGYPIEKVQKLEQDKFVLDPEVDTETLKKHLLGFGVAMGLAIQGADKAKCAINLAPDDIKVNDELRRKVPFALGAAACSWLALVASYGIWTTWRDKLNETAKSASSLDTVQTVQNNAGKAKAEVDAAIKKSEPLRGLVQNRLLPYDAVREIRGVLKNKLAIDNAKIPKISGQDTMPVQNQLDLIKKERETQKIDAKTWVLELGIDRKPVPISSDPVKPADQIPEGVYVVQMKIARALPEGAAQASVRDQIRNEVVKLIADALKDGPYFIKLPDKNGVESFYRNSPTVLDAIVSSGVNLTQLNPNASAANHKELFNCLAVDVKFEIGWEPPPVAPPADPNNPDAPKDAPKEGPK